MRLTSNEALELLNNSKITDNDNYWIEHCICVGNAAGKIADSLNLDSEYAKTLGYIHDIGKKFQQRGGVLPHIINGYKYIKELGFDEDYAGICIKHSFLNNDINCLANDRDETDKTDLNYDFVKKYIESEYTIYEKIINLCDLMCKKKISAIDKRIIDILTRNGAHKQTYYHLIETYKLKKFFDDKLGYNLYDLFPEIKDNL